MEYLDGRIKNRLTLELKLLNGLRPLPDSAVKKLREHFQIEMTYNSNAIEGNSLTLKETAWVISEGITVKGKSLKDHLEAKDHYEALNYLFEVVDPKKPFELSESTIKGFHELVMQKTDKEWAGRYRTGEVIITGSAHKPIEALSVPGQMHDLILWYKKSENNLHPVELSSLLHHKLVFIHPFFDGNGRTARLIMNLVLLRSGYPLSVILKNDRPRYYRSLQQADVGNYVPLMKLVALSVERSLSIYLKSLLPVSGVTRNYQPLSKVATELGYSEKHLNLLARDGKIQAFKEKRNWVTTKDAVLEYMNSRQRKR